MCAGISHAKGKDFSWALWYEKSPRSFMGFMSLFSFNVNVTVKKHNDEFHGYFIISFGQKMSHVKQKQIVESLLMVYQKKA